MKSYIALTVAAFTLAACGGGGGGSDSTALPSTTRDVGVLPPGFVATLDSATDEVVLTVGGAEVARLPNTGSAGAEFTRYADGTDAALYAATISGDGAVFVVSSPTVNLGLAGVQVARLGETVLPGSGSATFNGAYESIVVRATDLSLVPIVGAGVIQGDAQLTADFASASISGAITNRVFGVGGAGDDIQLLSTAITAAGAFSGTTTGGDIFGATALTGEYVGLIVGDTGNEVVGGVSVTQVFGVADILIEIGGFVAAE